MRFPLLLFFLCAVAWSGGPVRAAEDDEDPSSEIIAERYPQYDGMPVGKIEIEGLKRSRESIVRWILGAREGQPFDSAAWQVGIENLYKTESLYRIQTSLARHREGDRETLWIQVKLRDKWTLFPYIDFQGGGGAVALEGGIYESNFLGTFANLWAGAGDLNGEYSYEAGLTQKWFLGTPYSFDFEVSKANIPVTFQDAGGNNLQSFSWSRTRQYLAIGKQENEDFYWNLGFETFRDGMADPNAVTVGFVYRAKAQYHVQPSVKVWRVSHSDYLERGHELTLSGNGANLFNPGIESLGGTVAWKQVFYLPDTKNLAYYISYSHTSPVPLVYQYRLGGFDSVRGFNMNRVLGFDSLRANLEYRSTLFIYRIPFWDLDRMVVQGAVFTDAGGSWNSAGLDGMGNVTQSGTRYLYSAGLGLRGILLHFSEATGRIDFAKAIYPSEGYNVSFGVGQFF